MFTLLACSVILSRQFSPTNAAFGYGCIAQPDTNNPSANIFITSTYGGIGRPGTVDVGFCNNGKITGMKQWGWQSSGGIGIHTIYTIEGEFSIWFGPHYGSGCTGFKLNDDDYIDGYRVYHDNNDIYGIGFHTKNELEYECVYQTVGLSDSGWIIYPGYYLTGLFGKADDWIQNIKFEFSRLFQNDQHKSYTVIDSVLSWQNANTYCQNIIGTNLATMTTSNEVVSALQTINNAGLSRESFWIGLNDLTDEGVWKWVSGTSCNYAPGGLCKNDFHWDINEPNNLPGEHCGHFHAAVTSVYKAWNDLNCEIPLRFICDNPKNLLCDVDVNWTNEKGNWEYNHDECAVVEHDPSIWALTTFNIANVVYPLRFTIVGQMMNDMIYNQYGGAQFGIVIVKENVYYYSGVELLFHQTGDTCYGTQATTLHRFFNDDGSYFNFYSEFTSTYADGSSIHPIAIPCNQDIELKIEIISAQSNNFNFYINDKLVNTIHFGSYYDKPVTKLGMSAGHGYFTGKSAQLNQS
eukprot:26609_1